MDSLLYYKHLFLFEGSEVEEMKGIAIGFVIIEILITGMLYCCVRVGAEADRRMEELQWKGEEDAGRSK